MDLLRLLGVALLCIAVTMLTGCNQTHAPTPPARPGAELHPVSTPIGDDQDIAFPQRAIRLANGHIAYAVDAVSGLVRIADSLGATVGLTGRQGQGPGEYYGASWLLPYADGLLLGTSDGRTLRFDGEAKFQGQLPLSLQLSGYMARLGGDTLVVAQPMSTPQRFGLPFHVLTLAGDTLRSFGADDRSIGDVGTLLLYRSIAAASDSTFWAVHPFTYRVQLWSTGGTKISDIRVSRAGFPDDVSTRSVAELIDEFRPAPRIRSIWQRDDGKLVLLIERQKANLPERPPQASGGEVAARGSARMSDLDQVLEVIDPWTGELQDSLINPGPVYLMGALSGDVVWGLMADDDGREQPRVFRIAWDP